MSFSLSSVSRFTGIHECISLGPHPFMPTMSSKHGMITICDSSSNYCHPSKVQWQYCMGCREASSCPVWSDRKSPPTQSPYCVSTTVPCVITYLARILRSCQYLASAVTHVRIDLARDMLHVTSNKIASSYTTNDPVKTTSKLPLRCTMPSKGLQQDQATPQQDVKNVYHCHTSWGCVNLSGCCPYFGRMQTSGGGVTWPHPSR